ncbi:MAG: hypothetical protein RXO24_12040 [Acidilobus sp.]
MEAQPREVMICPRCGQPISYIERQRRGNQVYYYAVHYLGYERGPDDRIHKKVKRCYLGPEAYIEVSKLHADLGLKLKGLMEGGRERYYINALVEAIEERMKDGRLGPEEALELARSIDRLAELARRLRGYAATRPLPPGGLTTEEVRELLEAARELKRAQASR